MLQAGGVYYYRDTLEAMAVQRDVPKVAYEALLWLSAKNGVDDQVATEDVLKWTNPKYNAPYEFISQHGYHPQQVQWKGKPGLKFGYDNYGKIVRTGSKPPAKEPIPENTNGYKVNSYECTCRMEDTGYSSCGHGLVTYNSDISYEGHEGLPSKKARTVVSFHSFAESDHSRAKVPDSQWQVLKHQKRGADGLGRPRQHYIIAGTAGGSYGLGHEMIDE